MSQKYMALVSFTFLNLNIEPESKENCSHLSHSSSTLHYIFRHCLPELEMILEITAWTALDADRSFPIVNLIQITQNALQEWCLANGGNMHFPDFSGLSFKSGIEWISVCPARVCCDSISLESFSHNFQFQIWNLQFSLHCTPSTISTKRQIILQLQIHSRENIFSAFYCLLKLGKSYNGILSTLPKEFPQISALVFPYLRQPFTNFSYWGVALLQILSSPTISIFEE